MAEGSVGSGVEVHYDPDLGGKEKGICGSLMGK